MSTEYSDRRIRDILTKVNGNAKLAEQAIMNLLTRDPNFVLSLVEPYLNGIIAHAIDRARKGTGIKEPATKKTVAQEPLHKRTVGTAKPAQRPQNIPSSNMDGLLAAMAKQFEANSKPAQPGDKKVSQKHLQAMQALIKNPKK